MTPFLALVRLELAVLFGSPLAYLTLTGFAGVSALLFLEPLRVYNQLLFAYASTNLGGFDTGAIPDSVNLWDTVFFPVMDSLGLTLLAAVPLVGMRSFAEDRARGRDELLLCSGLGPGAIVAAKFAVCAATVLAMLAVAFVYPAATLERGDLGSAHLAAVFLALAGLGLGLTALALACSALTEHQLVAALCAWALGFALWDFGWAAPLTSETVARGLQALALRPRFAALSEGLVSAADLAYFAGLVAVGAAVARASFDLRRARA